MLAFTYNLHINRVIGLYSIYKGDNKERRIAAVLVNTCYRLHLTRVISTFKRV